jgi:hypothetical protein
LKAKLKLRNANMKGWIQLLGQEEMMKKKKQKQKPTYLIAIVRHLVEKTRH